ncbi:hypothetical protein DY000_02020191 [Brassica cretica]|uniref:Dirigent protein n=1 Tax=Brassica cretica TaxID=69181 RepID=A0ABQ7EEK8_BRACR|nr:hypothetical protein DY000_02020191 [Brassica cretica]
MIHYPVLRPRHPIVYTEERRDDQVRIERRNRIRPISQSPVRIHPKATTMAYPVHTLDVRSGVPVAVCFAFSLRSTMIGSFFQQSRSDRLLDLIPVKPSLQFAQVSLSLSDTFGSDRTLVFFLKKIRVQNRPQGPIFRGTQSGTVIGQKGAFSTAWAVIHTRLFGQKPIPTAWHVSHTRKA